MDKDGTRIEMKVEGLTLDPVTNMPIIILKDMEGRRTLPIWVGIFEANAIALEMEKINTPRPMTHDLIRNILDGIDAKVKYVCVNDLRDNTFYAEIGLILHGMDVKIDSRPSDAIAVALRMKAPIMVSLKVVEEARSFDVQPENQIGENDQWKGWLDNIKPSDFGNIDQ